jgi:hypothetical protein
LHLPADLHDPRGIPMRGAKAVPGKRRLNARAEYQRCDLYIAMRRLTQAVGIKAHAGMRTGLTVAFARGNAFSNQLNEC